jgi:hypothetical protein
MAAAAAPAAAEKTSGSSAWGFRDARLPAGRTWRLCHQAALAGDIAPACDGLAPSGAMEPAMSTDALTRQLLEWIGEEPRSYVETMDAWRTSCPRLTIWEDALSAGLIRRVPGSSIADAAVQVTKAGETFLRGTPRQSRAPDATSADPSAPPRLPTFAP